MQIFCAPETGGNAVHFVVVIHAIEIKNKHYTTAGSYNLSKINFYLILLSIAVCNAQIFLV